MSGDVNTIQICESLNSTSIDDSEFSKESQVEDHGKIIPNSSEQLLNSHEWLSKKKHVFILSESGKPIYSRYSELFLCICIK